MAASKAKSAQQLKYRLYMTRSYYSVWEKSIVLSAITEDKTLSL
ncbi:hypothetical protein [Paratissierella segnis]|nr:hypothetical protein [Paratissierella segnis]